MVSDYIEKLLVADWKKCTGCLTCTFICSFHHEGVFSPYTSRVRIVEQEERGVSVPVLCEHCEDPPCVSACPQGALEIDEKGTIRYLKELCTLCKACIEACPYYALAIGKLKGEEILLKCDLCGGDPECAKYCAPGALEWVERTSKQEERKRMLTENRMSKLKEVL